jgi:PIN domain nuclease of toxin-antitoxin system
MGVNGSDRPIVLDTHVWVDLGLARGRFSTRVVPVLERAAERDALLLAPISCWEIASLAESGRLRLGGPTLNWLLTSLQLTRTKLAPFDAEIAVDAAALGWEHRDPADRFIVATARSLDAYLCTRDTNILGFAERSHAVRVLEP